MSGRLLQKLRDWRDKRAKQKGVEDYRVLQNKSLSKIAQEKPESKEELLDIYGIAEKKYKSYGKEILRIVADEDGDADADEPISVSAFLQQINDTLADQTNRVSGEVVEFDIRDNYLFFTIKDPEAEASMQCFMWRRDYDLSDVELEEGLEIAVEGIPEIYKPNGRFTFRVSVMELVGEGALKQAYEKLKAKLEKAGVFADERKQDLPAFPQRVGLITSKDSDAYHDFLANLGSFGFSVAFHPSRVQGAKAVKDLFTALEYFAGKEDIDALVITRGGGGNLEVLQAFNNESVVNKLAELEIPTIVGVGHEQDVPLAALAADKSVSTPTACAEILNQPWEKLLQRIQQFKKQIIRNYETQLHQSQNRLHTLAQSLQSHMETTFLSFQKVVNALQSGLRQIGHQLQTRKQTLQNLSQNLIHAFTVDMKDTRKKINRLEDQLKRVNPQRRLEQGYSIVTVDDTIVRSIEDVSVDQDISVQVADGTINSNVLSKQSNDDKQ
jgi:exodeoxyribonuclease VII large subunit